MQFDSFQAFVAMGGYGLYVWSALLVTFLGLAGLFLETSWSYRKIQKEARAAQARQARIDKARQQTHSN